MGAFEGEVGVQAPLGLFDPLGLLDDADQERFDRLRYVEVKHGRIAQLAFAPAQVAQTSTALNAFEGEVGVQAPLGLFDPLGLLDDADQEFIFQELSTKPETPSTPS